MKNLQIEALAGTGKTFTLVEGMKRMVGGKGTAGIVGSPQQEAIWDAFGKMKQQPSYGGSGVLFVAFNKSIAEELKKRIPFGTDAMTLHAFGLSAVKRAFPDKLKGYKSINGYRVQNLCEKLYGVDFRELRKTGQWQKWSDVINLVGLCKQTLADGSEESLFELTDHYGIECESESFTFPKVPELLNACKEITHEIDFNDMIWLPVVLDLPINRRQVMLVDEVQDLNRCQQILALRSADRLITCGDSNQSIYGFAGADPGSMNRLKTAMSGIREDERLDGIACAKNGVDVLPLTVTRRCCKTVTQLAKNIVPAFDCLPDAPDGIVESVPSSAARARYAPGDMVLCRTNAPLIAEAFALIRERVPCRIQGRDFGATLIKFTRKLMKSAGIDESASTPSLAAEAEDWRIRELARLGAMKNVSQTRLDMVRDQSECVIDACAEATTVGKVLTTFESLFSDDVDARKVSLSSVHRSKGLEAESVFILRPETLPLKRRKQQPWEVQQERNLQYVAYTRAVKHLTFCETEKKEKEETPDGE